MSSSSATMGAHGHDAERHPKLKEHFATIQVQDSAVRLGMWMFLGTEVLLFAGLFCGYAIYRFLFHEDFKLASDGILNWRLGGLNTVVLLLSSWTVALGVHAARAGDNKKAAGFIVATLACAATFMVVKYFEYSHKFHVGALPGSHYWMTFESSGITDPARFPKAPGSILFFTVYFLATGLHGFHVLIGMGVLTWILVRCIRGEFSTRYYIPVELAGLYWHLVDLIWIFLFPFLYLI